MGAHVRKTTVGISSGLGPVATKMLRRLITRLLRSGEPQVCGATGAPDGRGNGRTAWLVDARERRGISSNAEKPAAACTYIVKAYITTSPGMPASRSMPHTAPHGARATTPLDATGPDTFTETRSYLRLSPSLRRALSTRVLFYRR